MCLHATCLHGMGGEHIYFIFNELYPMAATTSNVQSCGFVYDYYPPFWNWTCLYEMTKVKD
jgi:hypothetical protein